MKTIKLLLCVFLSTMSFNVFADEVGRYQMQEITTGHADWIEVFVLDTKTGAIKYCYKIRGGMTCTPNRDDTKGIQRAP